MSLALDAGDLCIAAGQPTEMTDQIKKRCRLGPGKLVLEPGCGSGKFALNLALTTNCTSFLLDNDRGALERAGRYLLAVNGLYGRPLRAVIEPGDLLHLPYGDDTFDLVFNEGVLEHFDPPTIPLMEMARVSRADVVAMVPNAMNEKQVGLARSQTEQYAGKQHWAAYEKPMLPGELKGYMEIVGLKDVETDLIFPEPNPPKSDADFRIVFAMGRKK